MPANIYTSSQLTERTQAKQIAKSFLGRMNTGGNINNTQSFGAPLGIWNDSIMNEVNNGKMTQYQKKDGTVCIDLCCTPESQSKFQIPGSITNFFIYLNGVTVTWSPPTNFILAGSIVYTITANSSNGGITVSGTTGSNEYNFDNLTPFKTYTFTVIASNSSGTSAPVTSYSIFSPPDVLGSIVQSLSITSNGNVWGSGLGSTAGENNFTKQKWSNGYQYYGSIQSIFNTYPAVRQSSVFGLSDLIGYMTTHNTAADPGITSGVWKTTDGGLSWTSLTDGKIFLTDFPFPDFSYWWNTNEGFVVSDSPTYPAGACEGYYTTDGGVTWTASTGITNGLYSFATTQVYSVVGDTIWFLSKDASNNVYIHKSTDKGQNFSTQLILNTTRASLYISFRDSNFGILGVNNTQILYRTANGGSNWVLVPGSDLPTDIIVNACTSNIIDPENGYLNAIWLIGNSLINGYLQNTTYLIKDIFATPLDIAQTSNLDNISSITTRDNYIYGTSSNQSIIKSSNSNNITVPYLNEVYRGDESVLLQITAPNRMSITQFSIQIYEGDILINTQTAYSYPVLITGLTNGISYKFKASAGWQISETGGFGPYTDFTEEIIPSVGVPVPTRFGGTGFSSLNNTFSGRIIQPANDGGSPVIDYTVEIEQNDGHIETIPNIVTPFMTVDLPSNSNITVAKVFARNSNGTQTQSLLDLSNSWNSSPVVIINSITSTVAGSIDIDVSKNTGEANSNLSYSVGIVSTSTFTIITNCIPNSYEFIPVTSDPQIITVTGLTSGEEVQVSVIITSTQSGSISASALGIITVL